MKTLLLVFASTATLLVIFTNQAHSGNFMQNGKEYDDKFYAMFSERAPVKDIIKLAVSWNAEKQLNHFNQLYHHINNQDESAKYAAEIVKAARVSLQKSLDQVGFEKKITLEQYLLGTYQIQNGMKFEVEQDVLEALDKLNHFSNEEFEKLLDEGEQEEVDWELEHLYPYKIIPRKSQKADSTPKSPEVGDSSANGSEPLIPETPVTENPKSEEPIEKSQESVQNPVPESQESEAPVQESDESVVKPVEETTESVEEVVAAPEADKPIEEPKESVEGVVAESEADKPIEEPKESVEEVVTKPESTDNLVEEPKQSAEEVVTEPTQSQEIVSETQESEPKVSSQEGMSQEI